MGDNPKWLKRKVRARMKETGEKYTTALRAIQKEMEERDGLLSRGELPPE